LSIPSVAGISTVFAVPVTEYKTGGVGGAVEVGMVDGPPQEASAIPNRSRPTQKSEIRIAA
jgi:hypothetical protein